MLNGTSDSCCLTKQETRWYLEDKSKKHLYSNGGLFCGTVVQRIVLKRPIIETKQYYFHQPNILNVHCKPFECRIIYQSRNAQFLLFFQNDWLQLLCFQTGSQPLWSRELKLMARFFSPKNPRHLPTIETKGFFFSLIQWVGHSRKFSHTYT